MAMASRRRREEKRRSGRRSAEQEGEAREEVNVTYKEGIIKD